MWDRSLLDKSTHRTVEVSKSGKLEKQNTLCDNYLLDKKVIIYYLVAKNL